MIGYTCAHCGKGHLGLDCPTRAPRQIVGYTCAWCGGGHLGVDCPTHDRRSEYWWKMRLRSDRFERHARRLRKLVLAHQEKPCEVCVDLARLENAIRQLANTKACVAAVIEGQSCDAVVTARWAARELRRMVEA